jgi:hypothetical protein
MGCRVAVHRDHHLSSAISAMAASTSMGSATTAHRRPTAPLRMSSFLLSSPIWLPLSQSPVESVWGLCSLTLSILASHGWISQVVIISAAAAEVVDWELIYWRLVGSEDGRLLGSWLLVEALMTAPSPTCALSWAPLQLVGVCCCCSNDGTPDRYGGETRETSGAGPLASAIERMALEKPRPVLTNLFSRPSREPGVAQPLRG